MIFIEVISGCGLSSHQNLFTHNILKTSQRRRSFSPSDITLTFHWLSRLTTFGLVVCRTTKPSQDQMLFCLSLCCDLCKMLSEWESLNQTFPNKPAWTLRMGGWFCQDLTKPALLLSRPLLKPIGPDMTRRRDITNVSQRNNSGQISFAHGRDTGRSQTCCFS